MFTNVIAALKDFATRIFYEQRHYQYETKRAVSFDGVEYKVRKA